MHRKHVIALILLIVPCGFFVGGCPGDGALEIMPLADVQKRVNEIIQFDLRVRDPVGGERWSISAPTIPDINRYDPLYGSGSSATFHWAPLATHVGTHQVTFTVSSGNDSDSETINIQVLPAGGAPRFIQPPPGGTFDIERKPCVDVAIEVLDEDDVSVTIAEREPSIEGGRLDSEGGHRANWHWCPTAEQVNATRRYTLHLVADDGTHAEVRRDFEIVLMSTGRTDCTGAAPVIAQVTGPGERAETIQDYEVRATITDDQGFKDPPLLYYANEQPSDMANPDLTQMKNTTFEALGSNQYVAFIPNLRLNLGEERTVFFVVAATDNDDELGTACDQTTVGTVGQFTAAVPQTLDLVGYCHQCSHDDQCDGGLCIAAEPQSYCGMDCPQNSCSAGECQTRTSRNGVAAQQCGPPEGEQCNGGGPCEDPGPEPNNEEATATALTLGTPTSGHICPEDEDFFSIQLTADTLYRVSASGWDASITDIDILSFDGLGHVLGSAATTESIEEFEGCPQATGIHYVWVAGYGEDDQGAYSLEVSEVSSGTCCENDTNEPNNTELDAEPLSCGVEAAATICPADVDWWEVTVAEPSTLTVTVACDAGAGDLDLELYDPDGTRVDHATSTACSSEVSAFASAAGTYRARVFGYSGAQGDYDIDCSSSAGGTCENANECDPGYICNPAVGCILDTCDDPGGASECPSGYFCPEPGGTAGQSACVDECTSWSSCRTDYDCKHFPTGRGCARTGDGETGQPCESFEDCDDQRTCLTAGSQGYCAEINCTSNADCPLDTHTGHERYSQCIDVGTQRVCLLDCLFDDAMCSGTEGTCQSTVDVSGGGVYVCALSSMTLP